MNKLTEKELIVMSAFIASSYECSGDFHNDNMSWNNDADISSATNLSRQQVAGLFGQLQEKGLISNSGESARGDRCPDYFANPEVCDQYSQLVAVMESFK